MVVTSFCFEFPQDESPPENFTNFLDGINKSLRPLDMEIRHGISEDDGAVHYGLVRIAMFFQSYLARVCTAHWL